MKLTMRMLVALIPFLILNGSKANAFEFSVLGATTVSNYNVAPSLSGTSTGIGLGGGALGAFDLIPFFKLETGALYLNHGFSPVAGSSLSLTHLNIPIIIKFSPVSLLSFGIGGYFGPVISQSLAGSAPSFTGPPTASMDFGLLGNAGIQLPIAPFIHFRFDILYEFGLAGMNVGSSTLNSRNLDFLVGFLFDIN